MSTIVANRELHSRPLTRSVLPFVTVIMPIRNEARFITRSLNAVLNQDYPRELLEVLVADGISSDDTRQRVRCLAAEQPEIKLTVLDNPRRIVSAGMNVALRRARGDVVVRVDGHTVIASDYVSQCVRALERSGAENVGGPMRPVGIGWFAQSVALATTSRFGVGNARFHYSSREEFVDTVYLGAWPKWVFRRFGLFDEEQVRNQDDEFNYRLRAQSGRIFLCPEIRSQYYNRSTARSLWQQYFQYGFWKVRVLQKHPRQMRPRQFMPFLFVLTLLTSLLAAPLDAIAAWIFASCVCLYAVANVIATLVVARREWNWSVTTLPLAFAILHLAYGCGFCVGLLKFWNRWRKIHRLSLSDEWDLEIVNEHS